ncbi:MAG TPA: head protein [Desulfovibrio sp.]|nr:head protein [Desulfovibrio sp.]
MTFLGLPDEKVADVNVENDGFFPDISVGHIQEIYRIPAEFESGLVKNQLQLSIAWANAQLVSWKAEQVAAGYETLKAIPAGIIGEDTEKELHYKHAVCSHAKAELLPQYESMIRAKSANRKSDVEGVETQADDFMKKAQTALAALQGKSTIAVEAM